MIFMYQKFCIGVCLLIPAVLTLCSFYAYQVNAKRAPDDPEKRDFSSYGPWLASVILPPLFLANALILILASLAFGFFLVLFPFMLLLPHWLSLIIKWIRKQALNIGNWVLFINTEILKAAGFYSPTIKLLHEKKTPA